MPNGINLCASRIEDSLSDQIVAYIILVIVTVKNRILDTNYCTIVL